MTKTETSADRGDAGRVTTVRTPSARKAALSRLGLTSDVLVAALGAGESGALASTPFHPTIAGGMRRWADTVAALRSRLADEGWRSREVNSVPQTVSPDGRQIVSVMSGNAMTGLDGAFIPQPRSARPKGDAMARSVQVNGQLAFFDLPTLGDLGSGGDLPAELWLLLYYRQPPSDGRNAVLRAELSRPIGLSESGHVHAWNPRILLPPIEVGPELLPAEEIPGPEEASRPDGSAGAIDLAVAAGPPVQPAA